jgi:hypothetical protein
MEGKIVAIMSGRVNNYVGHRFDGRSGEHYASRESERSNDEKGKSERR